jgi:hypothetical protein
MNLPTNLSRYYQILVEGKIPASWSDWFGGLQVHSRKEAEDMQLTTLSGLVADQAALRGILIRLWDLNLTLRSIQQVDPETISKME